MRGIKLDNRQFYKILRAENGYKSIGQRQQYYSGNEYNKASKCLPTWKVPHRDKLGLGYH